MTAMIDEVPYIRIVVCGDSAVGKSVISSRYVCTSTLSLTNAYSSLPLNLNVYWNRIASSQLVTQDDRDITRALDALVGETEERSSGKYSYEPTIGCQVHVLTYSCAAAPLFFVELIDVGGTSMSETSAAAQSRGRNQPEHYRNYKRPFMPTLARRQRFSSIPVTPCSSCGMFPTSPRTTRCTAGLKRYLHRTMSNGGRPLP